MTANFGRSEATAKEGAAIAATAIFGGTFDPIHHGHLRSALEVRDLLGVDEIRMVPAAVPPHREQPGASAQQRLEMLKLAISDEPGLVADDRELKREGASYTVETVRELRIEKGAAHPLVLIMGSDAFNGLHAWHCVEDVFDLAHIVVLARPGERVKPQQFVQQELESRQVTKVAAITAAPAGKILVVELVQLEISASQIRAEIQRGGSGRYLLPRSVWSYIQDNKLYQGDILNGEIN